jgi:glycosyltransferase involved in cell wall biosynthesis
MNDAPLVSMLIAAYNAAATLRETLDSVLTQTYENIEIIVVNDGSTDDTTVVLENYGDRIRVVNTPNGGLSAARNVGLKHARGQYIALIDADDICEPGRIRLQMDYLANNPDIVLCSSDFSAFNEDREISRSFIERYYAMIRAAPDGLGSLYKIRFEFKHRNASATEIITTYNGDVYEHLVAGNFIHPPTILFRRSILAVAGEFDPQWKRVSDWEWLTRASRAGKFGFIDRPLIRYRLSPAQMSGALSRLVVAQETIGIFERLQRTETQLYRRRFADFRRRTADCYLAIASVYAGTNRRVSLVNWWTSIRLAGVRLTTLRVLVTMVLPRELTGYLRARARRATAL